MNCTFSKNNLNSVNLPVKDKLILLSFLNSSIFQDWYGEEEPNISNGDNLINTNGESLNINSILTILKNPFYQKDDKEDIVIQAMLDNQKSNNNLNIEIAKYIGIEPMSDEYISNIPTEYEQNLKEKLIDILSPFTKVIENEDNLEIYGENSTNIAHINYDSFLVEFIPSLLTIEDKLLVDKVIREFSPENINDTYINKKLIVSNLLPKIYTQPLKVQKGLYDIMKNVSLKLGIVDLVLSPEVNMIDILNGVKDLKNLESIDYVLNSKVYNENRNKEYKDYIKQPLRKFIFTIILDNLKNKFNIDYVWIKSDLPFKGRLNNGIVEINENNFSDDTPFHEYLHPIVLALKEDNLELYNSFINDPEVLLLTEKLAKINEYKEYPEEEALVRTLSKSFSNLGVGTIFKQFFIWLKNFMQNYFNIKVNKLRISSNISDITSLMLDSNKYILETNYFQRYNYDLYDEFTKIQSTKKLTTEQQKVLDKLQENRDKISGNIDKTIKDGYYTLEDGNELKRVTSIDLKELDGIGPELAIVGTFLHDTLSQYLKLRLTTDSKNPLIYSVALVPTAKDPEKKYYKYDVVGNVNTRPRIITEGSDYFNPNKKDMYADIDKEPLDKSTPPLTKFIVEYIRNNKELSELFPELNDVYINYLYNVMVTLEKKVLDKINSIEGANYSFDDLLIFNELFVHNYDGVSTTDLYGGTVDLFIVSPSGKKYNFDLKTAGKVRMEKTDTELIDIVDQLFTMQQTMYKEMLALATDDVVNISDIESLIVHIPRYIDYIWENKTIESFIKKIKRHIKATITDDIPRDILLSNVDQVFNDPNSFNARMKQLSFSSTVTNDPNRFPTAVQTLKQYFAKYNILIPAPNVKKVVIDSLEYSGRERVKIVPVKYNRDILEEKGVRILKPVLYKKFVQELLEIIGNINKTIFVIEDDVKNIENLTKEKLDWKLQSKLITYQEKLKYLKDRKIVIKNQLLTLLAKDDINDNDEEAAKLFILGNSGESWDYFTKSIKNTSRKDYRNTNYSEYFKGLTITIKNIKESLEIQKNIIKAQENDLKRLIAIENKLKRQIEIYMSKIDKSVKLDFEDGTLNFTDKILSDLNNELLATSIKISDLKNSNILYQQHINRISSNLQRFEVTKNSLNAKNSLDTIIDDANFHLNKITKELLPLLKDSTIEVSVRAGYLTYIEKTIDLYKDIDVLLNNILSAEELPFDDLDNYKKELSVIESSFKVLSFPDSEVNKAFTIVIADKIAQYKKDVINLKHEENEIIRNMELYNLWKTNVNALYKGYSDIIDDKLAAYYSTKTDNAVLDAKKLQILTIIENKRKTILEKLEKEINQALQSPGLSFLNKNVLSSEQTNFVNEHILAAPRSNFVLISLLALLDTEIGQEYAVRYKEISEEIQIETAILFGTEDDTYTNEIKIGDFTFTQEQYKVFDNFIAYIENKEISVPYLLSRIGEELSSYRYELIFDDRDRIAIDKFQTIGDKERYIIANNLVEKYRYAKTLSLIDRVKYDFKDRYKLHVTKLKILSDNLFKNFNENYHKYIRTNNKDLFESVIDYLKDKNATAQSYNAKKLHFKDYLKYIVSMYEKMKIVNETISSKIFTNYKDTYLYDIDSLLSEDQYNVLKDILENEKKSTISKNTFSLNNGEFFIKDIINLLKDIDTDIPLQSVSDLLEEEEMNYLDTLYGENYSSIFLIEGRKAYEKYFNLENGKLITEIEKIKSLTSSQLLTEENKLRIAILEYKSMLQKETDNAKKIEISNQISQIETQILDLPNKYQILLENDNLVEMIKNNPFTYLVTKEYSKSKSNEKVIKTLLTGIRLSNIYNLSIENEEQFDIYKIVNAPKGVNNVNESALNREDFDERWDNIENNENLFRYYNYLRNLLSYFYSILPNSEINYLNNLSLPYMENTNMILILEEMKSKGFNANQIKEYFQKVLIESMTSAVQNEGSQPSIAIKPIKFNDIIDLYRGTKDANYQLHLVLQMLAYNAILFKARMDTLPLHNIIKNIATQSSKTDLRDGVLFNYHANLVGNVKRPIDPDSESHFTPEDREDLKNWELQVEELNKLIVSYRGAKLTTTDKAKRNLLIAKQKDYKNRIKGMYNMRKLDKIDLARLLVNNVRLVQLTYSLTGQVGNFINGMIQTSVVSSGTEKEREAYAKSFEILNGLLLENKVLLGGVYVGNIVTSSILGSGMGLLSLPIWLMLTQAGLDKYKNLDWLKSRFNSNVKKALNMERNYNITYDVIENARANKVEDQRYKYDKKSKTVVESERDFIELMKPFGFVKRAEKLLAIQNMLIQSFLSEVTINGKVINFWDLHNEDGTIKDEYAPFITKDDIINNQRQLQDRLWKANGNYTSKYRLENYWWGQLFLQYAKWIPETVNNYVGVYKDEEQNLYSDEPGEGILRSAWKRGVELQYNLLKNVMVSDFTPNYVGDIPVRISTIPGQQSFIGMGSNKFDRIIIYKNGEIIENNSDKKKFVDEYNELVSNVEAEFNDIAKNNNNNVSDVQTMKIVDSFQENVKKLASSFNIKELRDITPAEKADILDGLKDVFISFIAPFDFVKSFKDKTITRNVSDRLYKVFPENPGTIGYQKLQQANLRRFYNFTHILYSMFITKTLLSITLGILTGVLDIDRDKKYIGQMTYIINRYNQLWEDVSFYSNPVGAFYKFFHNSMISVKFLLDLAKLNIDMAAAFPHLINKLLGDSEMGDVILESMGLRDPFLEKSQGVTNIRPVNDFIDMIPLFNKMSSIYKQSRNDYSDYDSN